MKHQASKTFLSIFLLLLLIECNYEKQDVLKSREDSNQNVQESIFSFIKAITTSDTSLFYSIVNADSIMASFSQQQKSLFDKTNISDLTKESIHKIFFLNYSPLKVMPENLRKIREKNFTIRNCNITVEEDQKNYCEVKLKWLRTEQSDTSKMNVKIRKINREWKITSADISL